MFIVGLIVVALVLFLRFTQMSKTINTEGHDQCPHCGSPNVEYSNYEWFCPDCGEQWDQYGQDTK